MSKNFELLRQVGNDGGIFQTPDEDAEGSDALRRASEIRNRILQNSALPDVFQTPDQPNGSNSRGEPASASTMKASANVTPSQPADPTYDAHASGLDGAHAGPLFSPLSGATGRRSYHRELSRDRSREKIRGSRKPPNDSITHAAHENDQFREKGKPSPSQWVDGLTRWIDFASSAARVLGRKITFSKPLPPTERDALIREAEIRLVHRVFPANEQEAPRVALFSGVEDDSGSVSICARTAEVLAARAEGPVCAVDTNFLSPCLHQCFFMENVKGLADTVLESGSILTFAQKIGNSNLWLLPAGVPATAVSFHAIAQRLKMRIAELRETFRYVVIHGGPLRLDSGSLLLSRWTDGVVLVVEADSTRRESVRRIKENLASVNVGVLGIVLNNRRFPIPQGLYSRL